MSTNMTVLNMNEIKSSLQDAGYMQSTQICNTMQGTIWRASVPFSTSSAVIKASNKALCNLQMVVLNGKTYSVHENILNESIILSYLTNDTACPNSLVKYLTHFESNNAYYLTMEDGGNSLFKLTQTIHEYILLGLISISEWHKIVRIIFKQMIECIEYIHNKNVAHFDVSLENFLINKLNTEYVGNGTKLKFSADNIQSKLCDFGLSEYFKTTECITSKFCGKKAYKSPECAANQPFDAKKNDIFSLGVVLFMLCIGTMPWTESSKNDDCFNYIMNGNLLLLLKKMNRTNYINDDLMDLFHSFFQCENKRINIQQIKKHKWLN